MSDSEPLYPPLRRIVEQMAISEHMRRMNEAVVRYETGNIRAICPDCYKPKGLCRHLPADPSRFKP